MERISANGLTEMNKAKQDLVDAKAAHKQALADAKAALDSTRGLLAEANDRLVKAKLEPVTVNATPLANGAAQRVSPDAGADPRNLAGAFMPYPDETTSVAAAAGDAATPLPFPPSVMTTKECVTWLVENHRKRKITKLQTVVARLARESSIPVPPRKKARMRDE